MIAIITANIKNKQGIAITVLRIMRETVIVNVKVLSIKFYKRLFLNQFNKYYGSRLDKTIIFGNFQK